MDIIFPLYTQLVNLTPSDLSFPVDGGRLPLLRRLRRRKTRLIDQYRLLGRLGELDPASKIRVIRDGEFTGIELDPQLLLKYVRLKFYLDRDDVLCVDGVPEKSSDILFRHRFFGCLRNIYWNRRPAESIARSDSVLATDLRNPEGFSQSQHLASSVEISSGMSNPCPPACMLSPLVYVNEMGFPINDVLSEVFHPYDATKDEDDIDKISRSIKAKVRERVPPGIPEVEKIDIIKTFRDVLEGLSVREAQAEGDEAIPAQSREMHKSMEQLRSKLNGR